MTIGLDLGRARGLPLEDDAAGLESAGGGRLGAGAFPLEAAVGGGLETAAEGVLDAAAARVLPAAGVDVETAACAAAAFASSSLLRSSSAFSLSLSSFNFRCLSCSSFVWIPLRTLGASFAFPLPFFALCSAL